MRSIENPGASNLAAKAREFWRPAFALALAAALSGCAATPRDTRAEYESSDAVDTRAPLAELPAAAGDIVAVMQARAHHVLTQRIVLRGDPDATGENAIVVKINQDPGPIDLDGPNGLPTEGMIASELDANFAGVPMALSQTFARNGFGPFGYAVGRPNPRVTCIYAWQFAAAKPLELGAAKPTLPVQPTSVRVRMCRSTLDEMQMLRLLEGLQVYPPNSRVAYGDASASTGEGDALSASGVGHFVVPGAAAKPPRPHKPHPKQKVAHPPRRRFAQAREERAAAVDPPLRGWTEAPMPPGAPSTRTDITNPLLSPLAKPTRAAGDDLPLPRRAAVPAAIPAASPHASIPLPN